VAYGAAVRYPRSPRPLPAHLAVARALLAFAALFLIVVLIANVVDAPLSKITTICGGTHTIHPDGRVECTGGLPVP